MGNNVIPSPVTAPNNGGPWLRVVGVSVMLTKDPIPGEPVNLPFEQLVGLDLRDCPTWNSPKL